jgi:heptaprenyl diphosphate synthase
VESRQRGQLIAAAALMGTARIAYYMPVLLIAGTVTGLLIGIASNMIITRLKKIDLEKE